MMSYIFHTDLLEFFHMKKYKGLIKFHVVLLTHNSVDKHLLKALLGLIKRTNIKRDQDFIKIHNLLTESPAFIVLVQNNVLKSSGRLLPQVLREVSADEGTYTSVAVSHSGRLVFAGNADGSITAIKYPLPLQREWVTHQAHCGPVTKVHPALKSVIKDLHQQHLCD